MQRFLKLNLRLLIGFIIYGFATVFMLNANMGLGPWDVFHQGLSFQTGITIGTASIIIGIIIVILDAILGERIGWGTLTNMVLIGVFIDIINYLDFVPKATGYIDGMILLFIGIVLTATATVVYLGAGLGSGPRDGLMIAIHKRCNKSVKFIRTSIEIGALIVGYFLGGSFGIGTVISSILVGYMIQKGFELANIDLKSIEHESLSKTFALLKEDMKYSGDMGEVHCVKEDLSNTKD